MDKQQRISSYNEFWPYYLREHSRPQTRYLHYLGTLLAITVITTAIVSSNWWLLPLALIPGYGFAWIGHFLVEKNRPATFSYPLWSFVSDFRMCALWITGGLGKELERAGVDPDSEG